MLVAEGIGGGGEIRARVEKKKFCFTDSIIGLRLDGLEDWQEEIVLGIYWSSFARYYFWLTTSSWGAWHDKFLEEEIGKMPIRFPREIALRNRIVSIVEQFKNLPSNLAKRSRKAKGIEKHQMDLIPLGSDQQKQQNEAISPQEILEHQLDQAIFDLYELNAADRDLVLEMCDIGLDLFYRHQESDALKEVIQPAHNTGTLTDVAEAKEGLAAYLLTFLESWNAELEPDGKFTWQILSPPSNAPLLAVRFTTRYKKDPLPKLANKPAKAWHDLLAKLEKESRVHAGSPQVFTDTFFRYVSDREIFFIKRNERRFWTRTAAREDAESALTHLMNLEEGQK